ncbi:MAG TPA: hypothetical protein PLY49_07245, partial [Opitutaceae bacterium]|nr:hypothetical protein [Opitutaceae bacterium]
HSGLRALFHKISRRPQDTGQCIGLAGFEITVAAFEAGKISRLHAHLLGHASLAQSARFPLFSNPLSHWVIRDAVTNAARQAASGNLA